MEDLEVRISNKILLYNKWERYYQDLMIITALSAKELENTLVIVIWIVVIVTEQGDIILLFVHFMQRKEAYKRPILIID